MGTVVVGVWAGIVTWGVALSPLPPLTLVVAPSVAVFWVSPAWGIAQVGAVVLRGEGALWRQPVELQEAVDVVEAPRRRPLHHIGVEIGGGWGGVGVGVGAGVHRLLGREHEALRPTRRSVGASGGPRGAWCPTPAPPRRGTG